MPEATGMDVISRKQEDAVTLPETVAGSICKSTAERENGSVLMHPGPAPGKR